MTHLNGWEKQIGGIWLKATPFNHQESDHHAMASDILLSTTQTVAGQHGVSVDHKGLRRNMQALASGDLEVEFYLASWDICERKPICMGAALGWDSYSFAEDGQLARAVYSEDICLLKRSMRQLISSKPEVAEFPTGSLAAHFERLSLKAMRKKGVVYRFGEVDRDNTTMMRQLSKNGADIGINTDSAVLEYEQFPPDLLDYMPMDIQVVPIRRNGTINKNNFIIRWKQGSHDIRFVVTKGQATAAGNPRIDMRPWNNGNLPSQKILECVIASALRAAKTEAEDRDWGVQQPQNYPSPSIPLLGGYADTIKALHQACGDEIIIPREIIPRTFSAPAPDAHVHIIGNDTMIEAFSSIGAKPRIFGHRTMMPGVNAL